MPQQQWYRYIGDKSAAMGETVPTFSWRIVLENVKLLWKFFVQIWGEECFEGSTIFFGSPALLPWALAP
jgi:hypothetical protein